MIIDSQMKFSAAQAITVAAASTNYIDLGAARNLGVGENLYVAVSVDVAFTDSGSDTTLQVDLQGDSTTTFTPDGLQTLFIIPALAPIGAQYFARISPDFAANYQFVQLYYTPANGNLTTGSITAAVVKDIAKFTAYKKGYAITG